MPHNDQEYRDALEEGLPEPLLGLTGDDWSAIEEDQKGAVE